MPIIRKTDPSDLQSIWDAIAHIKWQKLPSEPEKVIKELVKSQGSSMIEWQKCIQDALSDNLIRKSLRRDEKTQVYSLPADESLISDERDWYCFECHKAGKVNNCSTKSCPRVFHTECIPKDPNNPYILFKKLITNSSTTIFLKKGKLDGRKSLSLDCSEWEEDKSTYNKGLCCVCNMRSVDNFSVEQSEFRKCLKFVHLRSKAWIPANIVHKMNGAEPHPAWISENELNTRAKYLFFAPMDMPRVAARIEKGEYSKFSDFLSDILTIKHNIGIFHGNYSQEYAATEFVLRDVFHDLGEIVSCLDCFKHSSDTLVADWFSLPCRNPHELVWAKQKGFCYWPAKVIKKFDTHYDVRFFGGKHERSILNEDCIKPIDVPRKSLQLKNSCSLEKAINELELLQKFLKDPSLLESHVKVEVKPSRKTNTPRKSLSDENNKPLKKRKSFIKISPTKRKRSVANDTTIKQESTGKDTSDKDEKPAVEFKKPVSPSLRADPSCSDSTGAKNDVPVKKRQLPRLSDKSVADDDPIKISDDEDNIYTYSGSLTKSALEFNDSFGDREIELVTSSTEGEDLDESSRELLQLNHTYSEEVEAMRKILRGLSKKENVIKAAMNCMQTEINRLTEKHNDELKKLSDSHKTEISETKKKQWCYHCEQDAIYHCCWNTAYCSVQCQKDHWQEEHKKVCRRKR